MSSEAKPYTMDEAKDLDDCADLGVIAREERIVATVAERDALKAELAAWKRAAEGAMDSIGDLKAQVERLTAALGRLTMWLSEWRHAVAIRAEGGQRAWDELELAHNEGVKALKETS